MSRINGQIVFELQGESLDAALRLEREIRRELETVKPKQSGYMNEIRDSWNAFYDGLLTRLKTDAPDILALTGLDAPAIQVAHGKDTWPRAYEHFPQIFSSPEQNPRYFMYAPVDYKGGHFAPVDAIELDDKTADRVGDLLFAGGWLGNAPLVNKEKTGVALPPDYNPGANPGLQEDLQNPHTRRVFVAGGESLAAVEDFRRREREFSAAASAVRDEVERLASLEIPKLKEKLPAGEELRASVSYRYGGHVETVEMLLSIRMEGKVNFMDGGKALRLADTAAYTLHKSHGNEYTVLPRRDTEAGRNLAALMDAVPKHPSLADYPVLRGNFKHTPGQFDAALGINGTVPQARDLGGRTLLIYNTDIDAGSTFAPPGAKHVPVGVFNWLQSDEQDRNMGITPPPMPPEIARALDFAKIKRPPAPQP
ncbi:MAG TPA: hypothetical protein VEF76_09360 [Patescibacteria group bacterium]|nr:hypothetical protein [Patescibacteria group bacterium]